MTRSDRPAAGAPGASARPVATPTTSSQTTGAWGVLGGTFDPIHFAHLAIAEAADDVLQLSGVLFVPAGLPPHKPERIVTAPSHRLRMVELAIAGNERFRLSRVEIDRPGPSYTVETLERLIAEPVDEAAARNGYVFIVSVEALSGLHRWREPQRILELSRLAVVPRFGYRAPGRAWLAEHFPGQEERILFLDGPDLGHSASRIRSLAAEGRSIRYLVPDAVAAYIREHDLYPPLLWQKN